MKSRIARAGLITVEAVGIGVAILVACAAFVMWRAQSGPVKLDPLVPMITAFGNSAFGGRGSISEIEGMTLSRVEAGSYRLSMENVYLGQRGGDASALLPLVDLELAPRDLLEGKVGPRRILVDGAELRVLRHPDRKLDVDFGEATGNRAKVFELLTGGVYFREAFERAELRNARITFKDAASGRSWSGREGNAIVRRTEAGYSITVEGGFEIDGQESKLAFDATYDLETKILKSDLMLDQAPVGDLVAMFFNRNVDFLTSPISGHASVNINKNGEVISSFISGEAVGGKLIIGAFSTDVERIQASAGFDPVKKEFDVQRLYWNTSAGVGELAGTVNLAMANGDAGISDVGFQMKGNSLVLSPKDFFPEPLSVDTFAMSGSYALGARKFSISGMNAAFAGLNVNGSLDLMRAKSGAALSPGVNANFTADGEIDVKTLLNVWPGSVASAAKQFVDTRIPSAKFHGVKFYISLPIGAVDNGRMPDEAMNLSFIARDATVIYAPGMTPLTGVNGGGEVKGNSFRFDAERGMVGAVSLNGGVVSIPTIAPKGQPAFYRFSANGDAREIMAVLEQEPLAVLRESGLSSAQFSGKAQVAAEIVRPNLTVAPREDYEYRGEATFSDLNIDSLFGDIALKRGSGRLKIESESMTVTGDAAIGETPVTLEWRQRFYGSGDKTHIKMSGRVDSATGDFLGVPTRQFVQGPVDFEAEAEGNLGALSTIYTEADFTRATLTSTQFGWFKPAGLQTLGAAKIRFSPNGMQIDELSLEGETVTIRGGVNFASDGGIASAEFPFFKLDGVADIAISANRNDGGRLSTTVTGDYLNGASFVEGLFEAGTSEAGGNADHLNSSITARIERVDMRGGVPFTDASFDYRKRGNLIEAFSFSAMGPNHKPVSIDLKATGEDSGREQAVEARSDDIGSLFEGVFGIGSVKGGEGVLEFVFTPGGVGDAGPVGKLEARALRIVRAPLLAKVFAAGSLTGLADLMNGQGIEIAHAYSKFSVVDGVVDVEIARATGPSVGMTAQGRFDLTGDRVVDLDGAVAPAYGVNSLLGKTPLIGDLFVNREGEGLLALSYQVSGPASEPRVSVNPLSALAPGVLRRMFEDVRPDLIPEEGIRDNSEDAQSTE